RGPARIQARGMPSFRRPPMRRRPRLVTTKTPIGIPAITSRGRRPSSPSRISSRTIEASRWRRAGQRDIGPTAPANALLLLAWPREVTVEEIERTLSVDRVRPDEELDLGPVA